MNLSTAPPFMSSRPARGNFHNGMVHSFTPTVCAMATTMHQQHQHRHHYDSYGGLLGDNTPSGVRTPMNNAYPTPSGTRSDYYSSNSFNEPFRFHSSKTDFSPHNPSVVTMADDVPISPHENDVLMGRGGKNNQHSGNEKLRRLARTQCAKYRVSSKKGKSAISRELVQRMRELHPPARFLKRDMDTGGWTDVGDDIAREKASQVLRDAVALLQDGTLKESDAAAASDDDDLEPVNIASSKLADEPELEEFLKPASLCEMAPRSEKHYPGSGGVEPPTPGVVAEASVSSATSFPPPTPVESSRKRHRSCYSEVDPFLLQQERGRKSPTQRRSSAGTLTADAVYSSSDSRRNSAPQYDHRFEHQNSSDYSTRQLEYPSSFPHHRHQHEPSYHRHPSTSDYDCAPHSRPRNPPHIQQRNPAPEPSAPHSAPRDATSRRPSAFDQRASNLAQSQQSRWTQPPSRPQSIADAAAAARQASNASCGSLLGEVGAGGLNDFDLFDGGLLEYNLASSGSSNDEAQESKLTASPR